MAADQPLGFFIGNTEQLHHLVVNFCGCIVTAVENCTSIQILVLLGCKTHETEFLRHTVLCDHSTCHLGSLLNIIGSPCSHAVKNDLLSSTSAKISHQHGLQLLLGVQILLFLRNLHHITKCTHGTGHNGDLLHRLCILLKGTYQRMSNLVVRYDTALLCA